MNVSISINGQAVSREIEPRLLLVHFIRDTPGLTGTHWGCDTSNCGACVVLLDGSPVKSCTMLAAMAEGHEIRTVESLEVDGVLDPVQQGFHELHALQCGFCTPGMMMTARGLLDENPDPTDQEIRTAISGGDLPLHGLQEHRRRDPLGRRPRGCSRTGGDGVTVVENLPSPETERPIGFGRLKRKEDARFIRGKGTYLDDIRLPGMVHGAMLRSPFAHARIVSIDTSRALAHPNVAAVDHRQGSRDARARMDADDLLRHAGGARRRQGPVPGPGGRVRDRHRRVLGERRARADRRRVRAAARDRQRPQGARPRRAADPRRQGGPARQPREPALGGRRPGGDRPRVRRGRHRGHARHHLPALPSGAARDVRDDRRLQPRDRPARHLQRQPGAARAPDGVRARRRARRAHDPHPVPGHRRRLRQQGARVPRLRVRDCRLDRRRRPGEVGREPLGEPDVDRLRARLRHARARCARRTARSPASAST